jgi:His/Glu/Gln/Arg/opine family amino acid ABC transporter permease subunit
VERFARNFLDIRLLGEKVGLVWSEMTSNFGSIAKAAVPWALGLAIGGLLVWIIWRMITSDRAFAEPVRTMAIAGGVAVFLGLILDLAGVLTTNLGWLRITDRLGDIDWSTLFPVDTDDVTTDGVLHGVGSLLRFALLWAGYGAVVGLGYRLSRRLWAGETDEPLSTPVRVVLILAGSGFVIGIVKGFVATARLPSFSAGAWNTLILSIAGAVIGFGGGLLISLFTMSKRAVVRAPARIYINFFRGTPLIWQISFAGIGVVPALRLNISPYWIAILVLGLNLAAYSAEVYRAGIQSIERGQMEASRTLGLSYLQSLQYVIVPQAIRRVIPPLLNEFVILIKDTSLVSVLGLALSQKELLGVGRTIYSNTFNATAWLGAAAGFLIITLPMIRIVTIVERRMRSGLTSVI